MAESSVIYPEAPGNKLTPQMNILTTNRIAVRSLLRSPLRTGLMMAGILVGIGALTVLNIVGESTRLESTNRFKNMLGTFDTIMVRPGAGKTRGMVSLTNVPPTLKFEDASALAELPQIKQVALVQNAFGVDVSFGGRSDTPAIFGVSANWQQLRAEDVADGRFIDEDDVLNHSRVAVLGAGVAALLFAGDEPVGKTIRIGNVPFQVIGTIPSRGAGPVGASLDDLIDIPVSTAATRLFNRDYLTMLVAQLRDPGAASDALASARALLRDRHHIAPAALDDFTLTDPAAMMKNVNQMKSTLATLLKGVAVLATSIGCLVILGLMLASVTQRRGAIGVTRAVGATRSDILCQFLLEAAWTALAGGLIGGFLGATAGLIIARKQGLPTVMDGGGLAQSVILAVCLGVLGGLYPAWKAARVDPVLALRA